VEIAGLGMISRLFCISAVLSGCFVFCEKYYLASRLGEELAGIPKLPPNQIAIVVNGIAEALGVVYYYTLPMAAMIFILALFIEEYKVEKKGLR
jgi:hypothetical protein